jgi:hypothetical protein
LLARIDPADVNVRVSNNIENGVLYKKNEHGYGFRCLPSWLQMDRRPCSLAMRAV